MLISTICCEDALKQANTRIFPFTKNNTAPGASKGAHGRAPLLCVTAQSPQIRLLSPALIGSSVQAGGPRGFVSHTSCHSHKELLGLSREAQISVEVQSAALGFLGLGGFNSPGNCQVPNSDLWMSASQGFFFKYIFPKN